MATEQNGSHRKREEEEKLILMAAIVIVSTLAGWMWAESLSNVYYDPTVPGAFAGFLVGIILILTARLAAKR